MYFPKEYKLAPTKMIMVVCHENSLVLTYFIAKIFTAMGLGHKFSQH